MRPLPQLGHALPSHLQQNAQNSLPHATEASVVIMFSAGGGGTATAALHQLPLPQWAGAWNI